MYFRYSLFILYINYFNLPPNRLYLHLSLVELTQWFWRRTYINYIKHYFPRRLVLHLNKLEYSSLRIRLFESKVFHEKSYFEVLSVYLRNFTIISPVKKHRYHLHRRWCFPSYPFIERCLSRMEKIYTLINEWRDKQLENANCMTRLFAHLSWNMPYVDK